MLTYARAGVVNRANVFQCRQCRFVDDLHQLFAALRFNGLGKVLAVLGLLHLRPKLGGCAVLDVPS